MQYSTCRMSSFPVFQRKSTIYIAVKRVTETFRKLHHCALFVDRIPSEKSSLWIPNDAINDKSPLESINFQQNSEAKINYSVSFSRKERNTRLACFLIPLRRVSAILLSGIHVSAIISFRRISIKIIAFPRGKSEEKPLIEMGLGWWVFESERLK